MVEAQMQTIFGAYTKAHPPSRSEVYELKICKGTSLPFNALQDHQEKALLAAENGSLYHKITDQPWIKDRPYTYTLKKPFDCFALVGVSAFIVLWFYKPRKKRVFVKIPIKAWLAERDKGERKSITEQRAMEIGISFEV